MLRYTARPFDRMPETQVREFSKTYARRTLLASLVIVGMGFSVLFPLLAPLGREMGLTELQTNAIIAVSSLTVFLTSPIWGRLSDRFGRKRVMLVGLFGFAGGTLLFNTVLHFGLIGTIVGVPLFLSLIVARILHASVMSATMPASNAYMADITTVAERTKGMGAAGAANNVGAIMGPAVSGLAFITLLTPLWIMGALALLNGLFVLRFLPEPPRQGGEQQGGVRLAYTDPRVLPFIVVGVLMFSGFAVVQQTMGYRFQDVLSLDTAETARVFGLAMVASATCSVITQTVIVARLDIKPFTLLKLAMPILIAAFVLMAFVETQGWLTVAMMVLGVGMGLSGPGFMAGASLAVSPREQGAVAGVAGSCGPLGFIIGPIAGAAMYQYQPTLPYIVTASVFAALLVSMRWIGRRVTVHSEEA